jgi:ABC-type glucose/galactose transport system permease subunit
MVLNRSALLVGYAMAGSKYRAWLPNVCFSVVVAIVVYIILDLQYPRVGTTRVGAFDQALSDLRQSMGK